MPQPFTKEQLDRASNKVAENVLDQIISSNGILPPMPQLMATDLNTVAGELDIQPKRTTGTDLFIHSDDRHRTPGILGQSSVPFFDRHPLVLDFSEPDKFRRDFLFLQP